MQGKEKEKRAQLSRVYLSEHSQRVEPMTVPTTPSTTAARLTDSVEAPEEPLEPEEPPVEAGADAPETVGVPWVGPAVASAPIPPDTKLVFETAASLLPIAVAADMKSELLPLPLEGAFIVPTIPRPQ